MQAMKHANEGIHPCFETQGRCHQKSKTAVSVARERINVLQIYKKSLSVNFSLDTFCNSIKIPLCCYRRQRNVGR